MSNSTTSNTKSCSTIISNIRKALTLNEDEKINSSNLETSKVSNESTMSDSSSFSKDKESTQLNDYYSSFDYYQFEQNFQKYYVDSSKNNNGNYDNYVKNIKYDEILHFNSEDEKNIPLPLIIRPGTKNFLDYAVEEFDLVVFTASDKQYADVIIDHLEKDKKYFKMRFYRDHCIFIEPGLYIKDLRIFSDFKKLEDIIILDNSLFSFANQLNNGILITSFFSDTNDTFLENVKCYLDYIKNEKDIRVINKESFRLEEIKEDIIRNDN